MPDFALDYGTLHEVRRDLHELADRIAPKLQDTVFGEVGSLTYGSDDDVFGNETLASAVRSLYRLSKYPMEKAKDDLKQLGDLFGSVADGFFDVDSQIASGMGIMGANVGLSNWMRDKAAWDYKQENLAQCVPGPDGELPAFCSATDPGADPPTEYRYTSEDGTNSVHTKLTLDDEHRVTREETTIEQNGQRYTSVTTYEEDFRSHTTVTTFADGSTATSVVDLEPDGSGTMVVTDGEGERTEYTRGGSGEEWRQVGGETEE